MTAGSTEFHALDAVRLDGVAQPFSEYAGKVVLVVNVASRCGFTPQYAGLEALWRAHRAQGLVVLGFPCDQFGHQEPGDANEIREFCTTQYAVSFPLFAKIDVNGPHTHPVYAFLKHRAPGLLGSTAVKWNFTKFLVDRTGRVVRRYASTTVPARIEPDIIAVL
jgi:glutathione peroxidase